MIDRFSFSDLSDLIGHDNGPCVSIYLKTEPTGREIYKAATRLKQIVDEVAARLADHQMSKADAADYLKPLVDLAEDSEFWQSTENGLAIFLAADRLRFWRVNREFESRSYVSDRFFVSPLVQVANRATDFLLLSLGRNGVSIFEGSESTLEKIEIAGLPEDMAAVLNITSVDRGSQAHSGSSSATGKQGGVFHGQGGRSDTLKQEMKAYYREVERVLSNYLAGRTTPLILAGGSDQIAIYRDLNTYQHLLKQGVDGSLAGIPESQVHGRVAPIADDHSGSIVSGALERFRQFEGTEATLVEVSSILSAAAAGRIKSLFVVDGSLLPGSFDTATQAIEYDAVSSGNDRDLIEEAIAQTVSHRGDVFSIKADEMQLASSMAALLRY